MDPLEEFEFWCAEFRDNPRMSSSETSRLLEDMCVRGNPYALSWAQKPACHEGSPDEDGFGEVDGQLRDISVDDFSDAFNLDDLDGTTHGILRGAIEPLSPAADTTLEFTDSDNSDYPENWTFIARELKTKRSWTCEICRFSLVGSGLIQVHHIDGDKSNNASSNLQVLCACCHGARHGTRPTWAPGTTKAEMDNLLDHRLRWQGHAMPTASRTRPR